MLKQALAAAALAVAVMSVLRRRQTQADSAELWREATADAAH